MTDYCSEDGARRIKKALIAYWAARGHDVTVEIERAGFDSAMRSARFDVRSNMVNGLPRETEDAPRETYVPKPHPMVRA